MVKIEMPNHVKYILNTLQNNGYEAYIVGGCVRDFLLGKEPTDWDVCTSALPEQTMKCFEGQHIVETGLQHGTITLVLNHIPYEITTYRVDGKYTNNRRPDKVKFVNVLKRDLARRDFTINAMAYNPTAGLVDYYGGQQDLTDGKIKCVGKPIKRFQEDALRIMRALRFASVLGFLIEKDTSVAMFDSRKSLKNIAMERISTELNKLIVGYNISSLLLKHMSVIAEIIPELIPTIGFEQNNPYHCYDVLNHILLSVDAAPKDIYLRLTMLFHDIAKPRCYTEADGIGHFYGHPQVSSDMAKEILLRLKYDNVTIDTVTELVLYHDADIQPGRKHIKRWLNKIGEERFRQLVEVKKADAMAQTEDCKIKKMNDLEVILTLIDEVIEQQQCFSLKDLAVNGRDLIAIRISEGVKIGIVLNKLMDMVIDEEVENDKIELLKALEKLNDMENLN